LSSLTRSYRVNRYLHVLQNTIALNSYLGLFALCKTFSAFCILFLTREATLCPNILNAIRKLAQISKLICFHETRSRKVFSQLGRIWFRILSRQSENSVSFTSNHFSLHDRTVTLGRYAPSSARPRSPPSPTRFLDATNLYKTLSQLPIVITESR